MLSELWRDLICLDESLKDEVAAHNLTSLKKLNESLLRQLAIDATQTCLKNGVMA